MRDSITVIAAAFAAALITTSAITTSASGEGLPLKAPPAVPNFGWSGFYVGGNVGYGLTTADWDIVTNTTLFGDYTAPPAQSFSHDVSGIIGGLQLGYNHQNGPWVLGVEAMIDVASIKGNFSSNTPFGADDDQFEARIKSLFMATGRVGYAWDRFLAYGKAGVAVANLRMSVSDNVGPTTGSGSDSKWLAGPTVGIGLEYAISPQMSVGIEYDYIHLPSASYELGGGAGSYLWNVDASNVSLVLARLNYRFGVPH